MQLIILGGQGATSANSSALQQRVQGVAHKPAARLLLTACHDAFNEELLSLPYPDLQSTHIQPSDFPVPDTLLDIPAGSNAHNAVLAMTRTCLIQSLLLLDYLEKQAKRTVDNPAVILPFSSGILTAYALSAARNIPSFIIYAVDAFKIAFWIGYRTHLYRQTFLATHDVPPSLPWSTVVVGLPVADAQYLLSSHASTYPSLAITAITATTCITISGHPDDLLFFKQHCIPQHCTIVDPGLFTLYHSSLYHPDIHGAVMEDLHRRGITIPPVAALRIPIRSPATSDVLTDSSPDALDTIVRVITLQPVNWLEMVNCQLRTIPPDATVDVINVGPGGSLARGLHRRLGSRARLEDLCEGGAVPPAPTQEPIAIVGMAVRLPGARTANELWKLLEDSINMVSPIPASRFDISRYTRAHNTSTTRKMNASMGNFLDGVDDFDAAFFGISPREACSMDPQQRLLLQTTYEALESAGYVPDATPTFMRETFGCYVGAATNDYVQNLRHDMDVFYSSGTLQSFLSGRISYAFKFGGTVYCTGHGLAAIAGGVNVITSPDMFLGLDRAHLLSATGQCKSFDASADGYCRGEGSGMFVLKKLSDAIAEQDAILGVIRGIEVNHSGQAPSITHPHADAQAKLFRRLMQNAAMDPRRVSVVEAHGTGTQAGDPTELQSIREVFATGQQLHVTSIKANIGHLEAASGAAALAKVLMMMQRKKITPQISLNILNPRIEPLAGSGMEISKDMADWHVDRGVSRVAVVNNFGIAGSNATLLVEEYIPPSAAATAEDDVGRVFVCGLSAKTGSQLEERRSALLRWLQDPVNESLALSDVAYTLTARSQIYPHRLAVYASSRDELCARLGEASEVKVSDQKQPIVFVFSGQGGQYIGMGKQLYETSPVFRRVVDDCESALLGYGLTGARDVIRGALDDVSRLAEIEAYQAATFVLQCGLIDCSDPGGSLRTPLLDTGELDQHPHMSHNVYSSEDALYIVGKRARLMTTNCKMGASGMLAVKLSSSSMHTIFSAEALADLSVACYNSPSDCVVGGPLQQLEQLRSAIKARSVPCTLLTVPFAYHTEAMAPILNDLKKTCRSIVLRPPSIPVASNVLGTVIAAGASSVFTPAYFVKHCREPVRFCESLDAMLCHEATSQAIWVELGPHSTTLPMVRSCATTHQETPVMLATLRRQESPWKTLSGTLSRLYQTNAPIRWREVFADASSVRNVNTLPTYPFAKDKYWVPFREDDDGDAVDRQTGQHLTWRDTGKFVGAGGMSFSTSIRDAKALIEGHRVGGWPLYPASLYLEQIFTAVKLTLANEGADIPYFVIRDVKFQRGLVFRSEEDRTVVVNVRPERHLGSVQLSSCLPSGSEVMHAQAEYRHEDQSRVLGAFERHSATLRSSMSAIIDDPWSRTFDKKTIYDKAFTRVVRYSPEYQVVKTLQISADCGSTVAAISIGNSEDTPASLSRAPLVFLDALLHVPGFLCNTICDDDEAYICVDVGKVVLAPGLEVRGRNFQVYASIQIRSDGTISATSHALDDGPLKLVAKLSDLIFRKVKLQSLHKSLSTPLEARLLPALTSSTPTVSLNIADVSTIIGEVLGISAEMLLGHVDLHDYGLDSLTSIEARHLFKLRCNVQLPVDFFLVQRTIRQIAAYVETCAPQHSAGLDADTLQPRLIQQPSAGEQDPLILIHDGSGLIDYYERLPPMDRQIWGIPRPTSIVSNSLKDMAASYANFISRTFSVPVILGGWSFGGVVAYEAACLLAAQGVAVRGVVLIDSPSPLQHVALSREVINVAIGLDASASVSALRPILEAQFAMNTRLLAEYEPEPDRMRLRLAFLRCCDGFSPPALAGNTPPWLADRSEGNRDIVKGWEALVNTPMKVWDIPGHHFEPFLPANVGAVSVALTEACCHLAQPQTGT
ncbi:hypothetical protein BD626DRAFT_570776 [Schizophyllum amplum]|uniref:Uncharacterized protein n=1 Tax=Schizophyllum amplum TaxID=97359 RepID=A0A550C9U2_9AGAR|nr:hypothetical protein BD626DRAFT_570776 [Auriculariopsis ampla]